MDKKKILVVDDTDWNRDLLVQLLEENYAVVEAVDGEQGVKATEQEKPDLILMDLGMKRSGSCTHASPNAMKRSAIRARRSITASKPRTGPMRSDC